MDDAHGRLLRDLHGSGRPRRDAVMPESWPVLTGEHCVLRVLDEDDVQHWRTDEGNRLFEEQHFFGGQPPPTEVAAREIRLSRVAWALGGGLRTWGIWTLPAGQLAGAVQVRPGGGGSRRQTRLAWVAFAEFRSADLVQEALTLATRWALANLEPDSVIVLLSEDETGDLDALTAAGFRHDGPPEPWEVGRTRYRFSSTGP
jgi:RimJ/RimL family protein N-acetyltransferase